MADASTLAHLERHTPDEERVNSLIHGVGALLGIAALAVLVTLAALAGDALKVVSFAIYGSSLVLLYGSSTLYHGLRNERAKRVFRVLDHAMIYVLIAGTYTPFTLITLEGAWGWSIFGVTWGLAVFGVVMTALFLDRFGFAHILTYIGMGWLAVVAIRPLIDALPLGGLAWLVGGGLAYTGGVVFYANKRIPHHHAIWHLFVLAGSAMHFAAVLLYVLPAA